MKIQKDELDLAILKSREQCPGGMDCCCCNSGCDCGCRNDCQKFRSVIYRQLLNLKIQERDR